MSNTEATWRSDLMTADFHDLTFDERNERVRRQREERRKETRERNRKILTEAREMLKKAGIEKVSVEYCGGGDSGWYDSITEVDGDDLPKKYDDLGSVLMSLVSMEHPGWEINEGGQGYILFDVESGDVTIEHEHNIIKTEAETSELSFDDACDKALRR